MKKFLYIILSLFLVFAPAYSYATTSFGGWAALDTITAGATNTINATKTAGGKVLNSAVTVGASASKVGKHLIKGGGQAALAYAIVELLEEGIDWVLDPANNSVKYKNPAYDSSIGGGPATGTGWYINRTGGGGTLPPAGYYFRSAEAACRGDIAFANSTNRIFHSIVGSDCWAAFVPEGGKTWWGTIHQTSNVTYPPLSGNDEYKYIPIETVAAKVISNAQAGHGPSQEAVKATALEGFAAGEHDAALDAAATEVGTENPPDTVDPDAPTDPNAPPVPPPAFELPAFCSWAAPVCAFATWAQQEWSEFVLTITALKDWLFEEAPSDKDNTVDIVTPPIIPAQVAIDFVGGCPAPLTFSFNFYGQNYKPAVPFDPICEVAILINPVIKICATIGAAFIVAGIRQGEK